MINKILSLLLLVMLALMLTACDGDDIALNASGGTTSTPSVESITQDDDATDNVSVSTDERDPIPDDKNDTTVPAVTTTENGYIDLPKVEF